MRRIVLSVVAVSLSGFALAQTAFDREIADITLLQTKEVKAELVVTQAQRDKMNLASKSYNALASKLEEKLRKNQKPTDAEQKTMRSEFGKMRTGVLNALSANQIKRLREITLQSAGLVALTDPTISAKVGLSKAQVTKIEGILKDTYQRVGKLTEGVHDKIGKEFKDKKPKTDAEKTKLQAQVRKRIDDEVAKIRPQVERLQKEGREKIFGTLSAGQRSTWNTLLGKPFKP